jgi:hypothetical protein
MAYTLNEAICGRNKFTIGFQGTVRPYQYVRAGQVKSSATTILATEFINNWQIVSDAPRGGGGSAVCKSHRPVHAFKAVSGSGAAALNMEKLAPGAAYRRVTYADLTPNAPVNYDPATTNSRLDWVGRNHGKGRTTPSAPISSTATATSKPSRSRRRWSRSLNGASSSRRFRTGTASSRKSGLERF